MAVALAKEGLKANAQVPLRVHFDEVLVGEYCADLVVEDAVIVEVKATELNLLRCGAGA